MTNHTDLAARFEAKREECEEQAEGGFNLVTRRFWQGRARAFAEARDMARAGAAGGAGERVRHLKRGTEYEVLGDGLVQTDTPLKDYDKVVVYQSGEYIWVRPVSEFRDGRFETIAAAPPPPAQQGSSSSVVGSKAIAREGKVDLPPLKPDQVEYLRGLQASLRPITQIDSETLIGPAGPAVGLDGYNQQGPSSPPLTAERVDLGELERLSERASPGPWTVSEVRKRVDEPSCIIVDGPRCPGLFAFPTADGKAALEALADARFIAGLVTAYRSGHLVPASLPAGTGSADE
jgi:hypothetical protein